MLEQRLPWFTTCAQEKAFLGLSGQLLRTSITLLMSLLFLLGCSTQDASETMEGTPKQTGGLTSPKGVNSTTVSETETLEAEPPSVSFDDADLRVLFIGNSHTHSLNLTNLVAALVNLDDEPDRMHAHRSTPEGFLVDHLANKNTVELIRKGKWDIVVLQGQKYSTSGKYSYPTDAAKELTRIAQENGARVIMYPEWGQRGSKDEGERVHRLHQSIARETGADVAPVGLAWDAAFDEQPKLVLHAADGNHFSPHGAYLTACVLYTAVTGRNPQGIDYKGRIRMTDEERNFYQRIAWETFQREAEKDAN